MAMKDTMIELRDFLDLHSEKCLQNGRIDKDLYDKYNVQRGLRDKQGNGVVTGLTSISQIEAYKNENGEKIPCEGRLLYRGYNIYDLVGGDVKGKRLGFEETAYLLLFNELPNQEELEEFSEILGRMRKLPTNFVRDVIMKAPSKDIMNNMTRSILTLASYDDEAADLSVKNVLRQ